MKRPLLFALLGLSLAGNLWFLLATRDPSSAPASAASPAAKNSAPHALATAQATAAADAKSATDEAAPPASPRGITWRTPRTDDDYRALAADLRAAGFPSRLIYRVLAGLHRQQHLPDSPLGKAPYWQRTAVTFSKEMQVFEREAHDQIAELLGPDGRPSAQLDAVTRKRRYGSLSDAKIDAIAQIERDYQEMQGDIYRDARNVPDDFATVQKQSNLLGSEKTADLAKILTPAELAEYQLHNSNASQRTASLARNVTLSNEEFAALVRARDTFENTSPTLTGTITPEMMQQRQAALAAYYEQMRAALPDERFYDILQQADPGYRAIAGLGAQFPSVTPAAAYQTLQLQHEAQSARTALLRGRPTPEQIQSAYATWNARLDALLGAEAATAYRKTPQGSRAFNPPEVRRTGTPATPPKN